MQVMLPKKEHYRRLDVKQEVHDIARKKIEEQFEDKIGLICSPTRY